jgi:hypothetical protein
MFNKAKKTYLILSISSIVLINSMDDARAQLDYCAVSDKTYELHLFGASYVNEEDKNRLLRGLNQISKLFSIGDKVKWINHASGKTKIETNCYPGCPDKGMIGNLIDATCSEQVVKRDKLKFKNTTIQSVQFAFTKSNEEYSVIDDLESISEYYKNRNIQNLEAYVFHTTLPYGTHDGKVESYNSAFVKSIQNNKLKSLDELPVTFINANPNSETQKFWNDLKLNGHEKGIKLDLKHTIMD